jgi:methionyl-tRNA synthetase
VPDGGEPDRLEERLFAALGERLEELSAQLEAIEIRKSAQAVRAIWVLGNEYLTEAAPWTVLKTDPERARMIVRTGLNLVALFARLIHPFIPATARIVAEAVGEKELLRWPSADGRAELDRLPAGQAVRAPEVLFRKIEDAQILAWSERFGGADAAP